ncbi:MAG: glycosyltransferase [Hyphomicrobium sp.]|uniref:glycosyltransferase family 2 protein n=1 Tax=Hyphomicrobium sp. TaxID=82 RepID=UPI0039E3BA55
MNVLQTDPIPEVTEGRTRPFAVTVFILARLSAGGTLDAARAVLAQNKTSATVVVSDASNRTDSAAAIQAAAGTPRLALLDDESKPISDFVQTDKDWCVFLRSDDAAATVWSSAAIDCAESLGADIIIGENGSQLPHLYDIPDVETLRKALQRDPQRVAIRAKHLAGDASSPAQVFRELQNVLQSCFGKADRLIAASALETLTPEAIAPFIPLPAHSNSKLAVGICTYNRLGGLKRVLASIGRQRLAGRVDADVSVIVVDNSPNGSAARIGQAYCPRFEFRYVGEPRKGLSNARNAAIAEAVSIGATRLAFIDDDEMASGDWLQKLDEAMDCTGAAMVAGPSLPAFAAPPPSWLPVECYTYRPAVLSRFVTDASSANVLVDITRLQKFDIRFDDAFNETGGEDTHLIAQLLDKGQKIAWCESAYVWDAIPAARMHPPWLFRRWYRTGITEARLINLRTGGPSAMLKNIGKGLLRLGYGALRIIWTLATPGRAHRLVASAFTICRGAGYLAGAFGRNYAEYSKSRYR